MEYESYIGNRSVWGGSKPFGISAADRRQHVYAIGKTGTGKTTLLANMICQDIEQGRAVGVIDPHGDLAEELLNRIPAWRTDHVLYFNPADSEFPIGFNLVRSSLENRQYLDTSGLVSAFKHLWRESWGVRLEYILYASIAPGVRGWRKGGHGRRESSQVFGRPRVSGNRVTITRKGHVL